MTAALDALGLTPGTDQLVFTLSVTAKYAGTPTLSLTPSATDDNIGFSTPGTATGSVNLNITFAVALTPNLSAQDATFGDPERAERLGHRPEQHGGFPDRRRAAWRDGEQRQPCPGYAPPTSPWSATAPALRRRTRSARYWASRPPDLVNVTEQPPSTISGTLAVTASFGSLSDASANLVINGDPLSGVAPTVDFTGSQAANFQSFANLDPTDLLGGLSTLASVMNDIEGSSALSADVPLTNLTVGQAADFGSIFNTDIVTALSSNQTHTPTFNSIQQFETRSGRAAGYHRLGRHLQRRQQPDRHRLHPGGGFPATPASFTYDLTGTSGTTLGNLTDVLSTSATATLSISGSGSVAVRIRLRRLTPNTVQIRPATPVPANGVLTAGSDAHFTLYLTAPGVALRDDSQRHRRRVRHAVQHHRHTASRQRQHRAANRADRRRPGRQPGDGHLRSPAPRSWCSTWFRVHSPTCR